MAEVDFACALKTVFAVGSVLARALALVFLVVIPEGNLLHTPSHLPFQPEFPLFFIRKALDMCAWNFIQTYPVDDSGHFLIGLMVVSMNRLVWRRIYKLTETKYKLLTSLFLQLATIISCRLVF